ncbi:MAG TPA: hypothetical protein VND87_04235 [Stellaceae bacterium]|nr:hypothetical protein [Stellaceae bacterium]
MNPLFAHLATDFLPAFLAGMSVNFEIAGTALGLGVVIGAGLTIARLRHGAVALAARAVTGLMRAAPTFVVMFFLLNALPHGGGLSPEMTVAIALVPYAAAYVADSAVDAVRHLHAGSPLAGLLILPNIARAFFVLVMSSSVGAAIGVPEGIAVILRQAEKMPTLGGMLVLFAIGVVSFGIPLQAGFAAIRWLQRRLGHAALRYLRQLPPEAATMLSNPAGPDATPVG